MGQCLSKKETRGGQEAQEIESTSQRNTGETGGLFAPMHDAYDPSNYDQKKASKPKVCVVSPTPKKGSKREVGEV